LGVALLNSTASRSLIAALFYGAGAAFGFGLVLAMLGGLRERLERADVPKPFRGHAIAVVTAGVMSLAFLGFAGFARVVRSLRAQSRRLARVFLMLTAVAFLPGLSLALAAALIAAARLLAGRDDDAVERVERLLPRIQCAQCGYPGCR